MGEITRQNTFAENVTTIMNDLSDLLIEKNVAYGDSALNPVRIFSNSTPEEQLLVRMDDKLSRIARGKEFPGEDVIDDLIGYLVLYKIHRATKDEYNPT